MEGRLGVHGRICMICGDNRIDQMYMERLAGLCMMYGMIGSCMISIWLWMNLWASLWCMGWLMGSTYHTYCSISASICLYASLNNGKCCLYPWLGLRSTSEVVPLSRMRLPHPKIITLLPLPLEGYTGAWWDIAADAQWVVVMVPCSRTLLGHVY